MMCEYLCPVAGTHPSEKLGEVTRRYGRSPLPQAVPRVGTLLGPPKKRLFIKNAVLMLELAKVRSSSLLLSSRKAVVRRKEIYLLW